MMRRIRVLVVDDSVTVRKLISDLVAAQPDMEVAGVAANGRIALAKIPQVCPDIVTLDIEMPELDGLETLVEIRKTHPKLPVIMFSSITERAAAATLDALARGANDYVTKPAGSSGLAGAMQRVREDLLPKLRHFGAPPLSSWAIPPVMISSGPPVPFSTAPPVAATAFPARPPIAYSAAPPVAITEASIVGVTAAPPAVFSAMPPVAFSGAPPVAGESSTLRPGLRTQRAPVLTAPAAATASLRAPRKGGIDIVALGCSTGGPNALSQVLARLEPTLPTPIVITQHMPPVFTKLLAERLTGTTPFKVHEARDGDVLAPGQAWLAPGDRHLCLFRVGTEVRVRLSDDPPENSCRPAVDVMFRSVAAAYGGRVLGVILTGMGQDGLRGCQELHDLGAEIVVQDQATSVVWGMPGLVARAGLASAIVPIERVAEEIVRAASGLKKAQTLERRA